MRTSYLLPLLALLATATLPVLAAACAKTATLTESRPPTTDFDRYRTGAVEVDPKNMEGGEKGSQEMLAYLETKLKQQGVLEPLAAEKGAQLLVRIRATSVVAGEDDIRLLVDFVDAKSGETVGQVSVTANALGDKGAAALRRASDEIVAYMRSNRRAPPSAKGSREAAGAPTTIAPAAAATNRPAGAGVMTFGACTATCAPDTSTSLPDEDQKKVVESMETMLKEIRVCLDRVSAQSINPGVILRFEPNGQVSQVRVDAGGYDDLACVQDARSRPPRVTVSRAASVRCDYRCAR